MDRRHAISLPQSCGKNLGRRSNQSCAGDQPPSRLFTSAPLSSLPFPFEVGPLIAARVSGGAYIVTRTRPIFPVMHRVLLLTRCCKLLPQLQYCLGGLGGARIFAVWGQHEGRIKEATGYNVLSI